MSLSRSGVGRKDDKYYNTPILRGKLSLPCLVQGSRRLSIKWAGALANPASLGHGVEKIRGVKGAMVIPPWKAFGFFKLDEHTNLGYRENRLLEDSCFNGVAGWSEATFIF